MISMFSFINEYTLVEQEAEAENQTKDNQEQIFRLPIQYLDTSEIHELQETVANDLELSVPIVENTEIPITMYHHIMNPKTPFEEKMIPLWKKHYTTNTEFLMDSQQVIQSIGSLHIDSPEYDTIMKIWKDTKEDVHFLERYSYMELEMLRFVNHMPTFLQATSIINMGSPIISFLVPFILFLMPFFIVKLQGHSISLTLYLSVLKDVSRHHFIGKMINTAQDFNLSNIVYLMVFAGLYIYQIYQNYMTCKKFYSNITKINTQICQMQEYLSYTSKTMRTFEGVIKEFNTYNGFAQDLRKYNNVIDQLDIYIRDVQPFEPSFSKIGEIGTLLGCYYELYSNNVFSQALQYSFFFHGYIQNIKGIYENFITNKLAYATFGNDKKCVIKGGYYPALANESFVTNDTNLTKNMVITGPNAAGKTTFLKTTMLNIIFTQQFGCGFYSSCSLTPYTHLHSYLNIPDTSGRDSLFQAESRRCKEIIDKVVLSQETDHHFCIFDELYSGTNPMEATKAAYAFLTWLSQRNNVDFILTTHYVDICAKFKKQGGRIGNWKMDAIEDDSGDIHYTYKLVKGVSKIQGAIKVLREMDYPLEILQGIAEYTK
jgi:hypothetical protein